MSRGVQTEILATYEEIFPEHGDLEEYLQALVTQDLNSDVQNPSTSEDADLGFDQSHLDRATILSFIEAQNLYASLQSNDVRTPDTERNNQSGRLSRNNSVDSELDMAIALSLEEEEEEDVEEEEVEEDEPLDDSLTFTADEQEAAPAEQPVASVEDDVVTESQGLSQELLDSFPIQELQAKSGWFSSNKADPEGCPICLAEYEVRSMLLTLPCLHLYHESCIKNWLKDKKTCPICKTDISVQQA